MSEKNYALILAGGSGTRFWPLSRDRRPKQLMRLFDDQTLIEKTIQRLEGLIPAENILILTNELQVEEMRKVVTCLPPENILAEPAKRDTAPAVSLGVGWVARKDPDACMAVLPADHLIQDEAEFRRVLGGSMEIANQSDSLVTIGIKPDWACPSYGYVERGSRAEIPGLKTDVVPFNVESFREKPSAERAEQFLEEGTFTWNAGMFIWSIPTVVKELSMHCPELADFVKEIRESSDMHATIDAQFAKLPKISIDYALMEKAGSVLNIEATFDWDDVGGWPSVAKYLTQDDSKNSVRGPITRVDSSDNIVFSADGEKDRRVALLGVNNLIVVQTGDSILIADRDRADDIKKLVGELPDDLR